MLQTYSQAEMIAEWRLRNHLKPEVQSAIISSSSGLAIDEIALRMIDDWYYHLLDQGPAAWIPTADISTQVMAVCDDEGVVHVTLPPGCRRVISVKLAEWKQPARIVEANTPGLASWQSSEFIRGGAYCPVAVTEGNALRLYSAQSAEPQIESLICVMDPSPGSYILDRAALATIPLLE